MSNESAREFLDRIRKDADLFRQAAACKTKEERHKWVRGLGYDFTPAQLKQAFEELSQGGELTEQELEMVAGGTCCGFTCEKDANSCQGGGPF